MSNRIYRAGQALRRGLVAFAAMAAAVALFRFALLPLLQAALAADDVTMTVLRRSGTFACALLGYWASARFHEKRPVDELRLAPLGMLLGALSGALLISVTTLSLFASGNCEALAFRGAGGVLDIGSAILLAAMLEELVFRGLLFRALEHVGGTTAALVVQSLVFALMHSSNDGANATMIVMVTLIGAFWTCLYIVWRNLWVVALNHAAWNFAIFFTGVPLSGMTEWRASAPFDSVCRGPDWMTGGAFGPENSVVTLVTMTLCLVLLVRRAQRQNRFVS
ncbi:MAG TPA: CPBP family intramembrane glutamic endopeptidase [Tahibacter sp.]|nr:CPBP family intramembrane glutamic endopeptidase [Tahibacter sp.]